MYIQQQRTEVEFNKKQKISELYQEFIAALDPEQALQDPDIINETKEILDIIRGQIDPNHPLLTDARPSNAYRLAANLAFEQNDLDQALSFVTSGLVNAANDPLLTDLQAKVQNAIRIGELNESLTSVQEELATLDDYRQYQTDITELANLSSSEESPVLDVLSSNLQSIITTELDSILNEGSRADAEALSAEIGGLMSSLTLGDELTQIKLAHLSGDERTAAIQGMVDTDKETIAAGLSTPNLDDPQWETDVLASIRELDTLQNETEEVAEDLQIFRDSIAQLYIDLATSTLISNRFDAADNLINRGERIVPGFLALTETSELIAASRLQYEQQLRITSLKDQFLVAVEADNITQANQTFENLKTELPADDSYITTQAPRELAESYRRLAERSAGTNEFATALQLAEATVKLNPRDASLQDIFDEYRAQVNVTEIADVFRTARVFTETERADLSRKVNEIERGAPGEYSNFLATSETILSERINFLAQSDENIAAALADAASRIFTDSSILADLKTQFRLEPWPDRVVADTAIRAGELTRASTLLEEAIAGEYVGHPDVLQFQKTLEENVNRSNEAFDVFVIAKDAAGETYGILNQAKRLLYRAQGLWTDNPEYTLAEEDIDQLIAAAPDNPSKRILQRTDENIAAVSEADLRRAAANWKPIPSDRACTGDKASYGARARAICYDFVNTGWRGPQMVVVPAGGEISSNFAIGKYEVSVADWSKYCALTGNCEPVTDRTQFDDPITDVSLSDARKYVDWLSARTGKIYRLPTTQEWEYATSVGGELTAEAKDFKAIKGQLNCRVTLGDKILKGTGIATIKSGKSNKWGLYNFVGNVQEWVLEGDSTFARGGAFSDAINNCDISTARPHDGGADDTTGFKVILEYVG